MIDDLDAKDIQEWYEMWWIWDLPGRSEADVRYERMYDWWLRNG